MSPARAIEERPGVFGMETEHAVLFLPERAEEAGQEAGGRPPLRIIQDVLFDCILAGRKAAVSSGIKGGYFLENGGLVHLEVSPGGRTYAPILEVATPECRSPWDLLAYARAYDAILEETSRRSKAALRERGYRGQLAFGKNNRDPFGAGYGCHENYLVHASLTGWDRLIVYLALPAILAAFSPAILVLVLALLLGVGFRLGVKAVEKLPVRIIDPIAGMVRGLRGALRVALPGLAESAKTARFLARSLTVYPGIRLYSLLLRAVALRSLEHQLASFLVTRQVITGAGFLNFRTGAYELSQRASMTRSLGEIVILSRRKTVFDYKVFLFDPLALFRSTKRMSLTVGDSNLSDVPTLLKMGTTALVVEMIERGVSFDHLRLRRPLKALNTVSREGPWKVLELRTGEALTALEIQRAYLKKAKAFFAERPPGRMRPADILRLWEEMLDRLGDRPQACADSLDWIAKKSLLDPTVLAQTNWTVFLAWGKVFHMAGLDAAARARGLTNLLERAPRWKRFGLRRLVRRQKLDPAEFSIQRELYFQAQKIDLRFHELGGAGYQRKLEAGGLIRRLADPPQVERAVREPPADTRARVRGYYIQKSQNPQSLHVDWGEIELQRPTRLIPTPDPFHYRLPLE